MSPFKLVLAVPFFKDKETQMIRKNNEFSVLNILNTMNETSLYVK